MMMMVVVVMIVTGSRFIRRRPLIIVDVVDAVLMMMLLLVIVVSVVVFILQRIDGRFVIANGGELIAHDGHHEESVENGNDSQQNRMQDFGFLRFDVSRNRVQNPRREDQHDAGTRYHTDVN